jgi:hypothetical protein
MRPRDPSKVRIVKPQTAETERGGFQRSWFSGVGQRLRNKGGGLNSTTR